MINGFLKYQSWQFQRTWFYIQDLDFFDFFEVAASSGILINLKRAPSLQAIVAAFDSFAWSMNFWTSYTKNVSIRHLSLSLSLSLSKWMQDMKKWFGKWDKSHLFPYVSIVCSWMRLFCNINVSWIGKDVEVHICCFKLQNHLLIRKWESWSSIYANTNTFV